MKISELVRVVSENINDLPDEILSILALIADDNTDVSESFSKCKLAAHEWLTRSGINISAMADIKTQLNDIIEITSKILSILKMISDIPLSVVNFNSTVGFVHEASKVALSQLNETPPNFQWMSIQIK